MTETLKPRETSAPRQAVATTVFGSHAERLEETFTSFARNPFLELHAFVIGDRLPSRRAPGVTYHLEAPDPAYITPIRDADYRRWLFIDQLEVDYAMVVDGVDVLCLQDLPPLPQLLRGAAVAAVVEHAGGRWLEGGIYTSSFLNAGVTVWNLEQSAPIRHKIANRGLTRYRNDVDDQLALNEVLHGGHLDELTILPTIYNYRVYARTRKFGWATTGRFDGVRIYHTDDCRHVLSTGPYAPTPPLTELEPDRVPASPWLQRWRRLRQRWATRRAGRL